MSQNKSAQPSAKTNSKLNSSIVHKPFATGTLNFFNPHRRKSPPQDNNSAKSPSLSSGSQPAIAAKNLPKVFLNAELEHSSESLTQFQADLEEPEEIAYQEQRWLDFIMTPLSLGAIALILVTNFISGAVIWRGYRAANPPAAGRSLAVTEGTNLAQEEFLPLNLSTLSLVKTADQEAAEQLPSLTPISPALAPLNQTLALSVSNTDYHYVLINYTGDRSLTQARSIVSQVSLVNFPQGAFIYLGAFSKRQQAQEFVSQLKQQGLGAQVYPFD